jgi:hypothetical protein
MASPVPAAAAAAKKPRSYTGRLEIRHTDDFTHGRSTTRYLLVRGRHRTSLVLSRATRVRSGTAVVVKGRRVGSRLKGTLRPARSLLRAAGVPPGVRKTAVILVQFSAGTQPLTPDAVRQRVFTDADSTNAYYREDSYGDVSLVGKNRPDGDVFGWYTVPAPGPDSYVGCDVDAIAQEANTAAAADGFTAAGYQHVIYAFPYQSLCGWAGLGELPGNVSWINGYIDRVSVVAHELGHNMGLHHASGLRCTDGGLAVSISSTCTKSEYGDVYDVMGSSSRRNNAWHLNQIGFLPSTSIETVSADGTYTLNATSSRGGTQLLRVQRASSSLYYDLELRAAAGVFDAFGPTDFAVQGVTIHTNPDPSEVTQSLLIDANPGTGSFGDAPLAVGHTFTDGAMSITVQSIAGGVATVLVTTGAPPPDVTAPSVPGRVVAEPAEDRVALSWAASTDDVGVAGYRVYRGNTLVKTLTATAWTDFVVTPGDTYTYRVDAFDAAGNVAQSAPVNATVPLPPPPPPPPDQTPPDPPDDTPPPTDDPPTTTVDPPPTPPADTARPRVRISRPGRRARLRRRTVVRARAADAVGVVRTEVWVDGKLRRSVKRSSVAWHWSLRRARRGRHRVVVKAYDAAGNMGKAAVRVRVTR